MVHKEVGRIQQRRIPLTSLLAFVVGLGLTGCHGGGHDAVLNNDLIKRTDKFFDVAHVSGNTFVTVGYDGRILRSEDAGQSWQEIKRPVEWSLTQTTFVGDHGWAVGHKGTILNTRDGGKTWTQQQSGTEKTLFAVTFTDNLHGW